MNKIELLFLLSFVLVATGVSAENVYREFDTGYPEADTLLIYNFPYWIGVNDTGTLWVTNYFANDSNYAELTLGTANATNMTYVPSSNRFRAYITSNATEDVNFTVTVKNSSGSILANGSSILRFRVPFTVTIDFYKNSNTTNTEVEPYDNEFQYAVLKYRDPYSNNISYSFTGESVGGFGLSGILNPIGRLFPDYQDIGTTTTTIPVTDNVFLHGKMDSGSAEIEVYSNGTYDLYTWNGNIYGGLTPLYEFGKPQRQEQTEFRTVVVGDLAIENETSTTYSVFISAWEVYKWHLTKNLLKIIGALMVWGLLVLGFSFLLTCWLPVDMRSGAFATVLGVFALVTTPLIIYAARLVWT